MKKLAYAVALFLIAGCGNKGYEEVVPGLKMKKLVAGTERGMQNGTDYFYMRAHVLDENDKVFESPTFDPNFFYLSQLKGPSYSYDFIQALPGLKKGDSLSFESKADSLFLFYYGMEAPADIKGKNIHLHVKMLNVMDEDEYFEKRETAKKESKDNAYIEFDKYLREHNITEDPVGRGTIKVTTVAGSGTDAFYGDVVSIHMVQKTFSGIEIENSRATGGPFEYEIGSDQGLQGLDEALVKMKKGEKAMVYLPYFLAFGESGIPPKIPPYANIMMEIELLDIRKPY
jgi:FKBP-type peptidyl-prolyl cis-trans isomerase FkpA